MWVAATCALGLLGAATGWIAVGLYYRYGG
jgi:hypothetical protein